MSQRLPVVDAPTPLLPWLLAALAPMKRSNVKQLLTSGRIAVNGEAVTRHDHPLQPGDRVSIERERSRGPTVAILYEDAHLLAFDKPAGLLSVAGGGETADTAFARVRRDLEARRAGRPLVVHRLDRETSGLLLFAKSPAIRDVLQEHWGEVEKTYLALVEGVPAAEAGEVEGYLREERDFRVRICGADDDGAQRALTRYYVRRVVGRHALLEVALVTGRKHQIRAQLASVGHPVAGDALYGATSDPAGRLMLHAWRLRLPHPATATRLELASVPPRAFT